MNLYALGVPTSVVIDDYLVASDSTIFSNPGKDKSLWGPFYEKIFAKFHGNYGRTSGGWPTTAVRNIINSPTIYEEEHIKISADELWGALRKHVEADDIIQAGSTTDIF